MCRCISCGEFSSAPDAQDWLSVSWLWGDETIRRRGLGRYLLQRGLKEMHNAGYRHAYITTGWDSYCAATTASMSSIGVMLSTVT
ncbi:GNAT family N-acetyltransferase [Candidatus Poribacteria bacterium]|nr:GNAT family N-acetyltransferase [Candidatus Poribacteria bacterium]